MRRLFCWGGDVFIAAESRDQAKEVLLAHAAGWEGPGTGLAELVRDRLGTVPCASQARGMGRGSAEATAHLHRRVDPLEYLCAVWPDEVLELPTVCLPSGHEGQTPINGYGVIGAPAWAWAAALPEGTVVDVRDAV